MTRSAQLRAVLFLFVGLPMMARPAAGHLVIQCADGSPCVPATAVAASAGDHGCCDPADGAGCQPSRQPSRQRCVVRSSGAVDYQTGPKVVVPAVDTPTLTPAAGPEVVAPPARTALLPPEAEPPPRLLPPEQGRGPRAPPIR